MSAASRLVPAHLELGGKDAAYVHHDITDVKKVATSIADAAFANR